MGWLDTVTCEYPLPLPEDVGECEDVDWKSVEFATSSGVALPNFDGLPDESEFEITDSGELYKWRKEWKSPDGPFQREDFEKSDYSGELVFYHLQQCENEDYFIEFKALFWRGELKEIFLEEWKAVSNSKRKEAQKLMEKQYKEFAAIMKKWWFKPYMIYKRIVITIFFFIRYVLGLLVKITWKLEQWIT